MKRVLIIDSGSGGINVLISCLKLCPSNNYLLYLDDKNLPYGKKNEEELRKIACDIVLKINKIFHPDIVIVACNTLTSVAINFLRKEFPDIIFIGSEPAIKPALEEFTQKEILVLATDVTIRNSRILKGREDCCFCPENLPEVIDKNLFDRGKIKKYLVEKLGDRKPKGIVLGCTHFEGIRNELEEMFPDATLFGSAQGIAKRLKMFCDGEEIYRVQIMSSGDEKNLKRFYQYFNLKL